MSLCPKPLAKTRRPSTVATMLLVAVATPVAALAAGPLTIATRMLVEQRVAAADGSTRTRFVAPSHVVPGDRIAIVLTYRNTGAMPLADVVLANSVPDGMAYRSGDDDAELSVDGKTFGSLATLQVSVSSGTRAATSADVTHVRWRLSRPIPAGATGERQFQAVLK